MDDRSFASISVDGATINRSCSLAVNSTLVRCRQNYSNQRGSIDSPMLSVHSANPFALHSSADEGAIGQWMSEQAIVQHSLRSTDAAKPQIYR